MPRLIPEIVKSEIKTLRQTGHSIPEISHLTKKSKSTVYRIIQGVHVLPAYAEILRVKQGGSRERAKNLRSRVLVKAKEMLNGVSDRDRLLLLIGIYWGEGTKKDFSLINSDPLLIQTFIVCLRALGIHTDRLSMALRIHEGISPSRAKAFWCRTTGIPASRTNKIEIIRGKKTGKLPYGMCRVRVRSGIQERLLVQSSIELIGKDCTKRLL